ncbi:MAG: nucleotide exchange factor GrpE [Planctomycetota bacterium]|nr:nucleotide exchange factor GrpE [Planctomycetota bacterium]
MLKTAKDTMDAKPSAKVDTPQDLPTTAAEAVFLDIGTALGEEVNLPEVSVGEAIDGLAVLETLQKAAAAAQDRELRAHAELENFRKRMYRQMEDERKYAASPLACDLLPVVDNLERAIQAANKTGNAAGLLEGVQLVTQQFQRVLETHHCKRIAAKGQPFDPGLHQAISQQPSDQQPAGTVLEEAQFGYQLHDRVIRPSLVLVSSGPANQVATPAEVTSQSDLPV